ncbi:MAG: ATP-binding cassette domain-containing protein [Bacteroidales bacterium]|nr:ATP-binding cassette domain-containing protein [Bacteroidales bacterium]
MIQVKDLSFSYGSKGVLKNISMELKGGNIYGLLGENGVGKTTLLTLLCGLKKPQTGSIETDGRNPFDRQPSLLAEQFYLPDEVAPIRAKAIDFGAERGKLWPLFDMNKYLTLLGEFEVDTTQRMDTMSAGQLKKTWIAFALACNARHYFMDEPTNGLDIPSKSQFRKAIMKYTCDDSAIIISTHQVRDLEEIIDPIIILDKEDVLLNASLQTISEKLFFDYGSQLHPEALYLENTPSGAIQVYPNTTGEESKVNLEALFNAVHSHKDVVKALFA